MNLNCESIENYLLEYVYDEITDENILLNVKQHLNLCKLCREKLDVYKKIKETANKIIIDFPEEIWELQRQQVKKKINEKKNILGDIKEKILSVFNARKIAYAFLVILFIVFGFQFITINKEKQKYKSIIENMEILENINILEQLDFYEKIKNGDFEL